jgi:hypothetical protein
MQQEAYMATLASPRTSRVRVFAVPRALAFAAVAIAALAHVPTARAQRGGGDGFLFDRPAASLTLRGGFSRANAESEIFEFTTSLLTLDRADFDAIHFGGELAIWLNSQVDLVIGADHAQARRNSEFDGFVDNNEMPIQQQTRFERTPVTLGLKGYLVPRGRSIGQFAWVPARVAPYVGLAAGAMHYRFRQQGDFIDFEDPEMEVFTDTFESSGWTATAHGAFGIDFMLNPRMALTTEARYGWAEAEMSQDFIGFDRIDLSGISGSVGLTFRF